MLWYVYGFFLFLIALIHSILLKPENQLQNNGYPLQQGGTQPGNTGRSYGMNNGYNTGSNYNRGGNYDPNGGSYGPGGESYGQGGGYNTGGNQPPASYIPPEPVATESVSQFDINSPVDILNYEISAQPDRTGVAITFKNNLDKPVVAISLAATAASAFGEPITVQEESEFTLFAQDLKGAPGMVFRTVGFLWLPDMNMRKLELRVTQIRMLDGESIDIEAPHYVTVETTMVNRNDLMYLNQKMPRARYYPKQKEGYWICSCGRPNKDERETCLECKENKQAVFDIDRMIDQGKADFKREEERRRAIEKQRQEEMAKRRKRNVIILSFVLVFILLSAAAYGIVQTTVMPERNYSSAVTAFEAGDYEKAIKLFGGNRGYKDSEELLVEATYQRGLEMFDSEEYDEARFLFGSITYYKDSAEYMEKIREILY